MTTTPCVSVIIIFYNTAAFLAEAVDSVLAQTYSDWELLLVDDGSSDESTAIAQRYVAAAPKRIKYLDHPGHQNRGMSAARNRGLAEARGRFVAFLDADDVWLPEKLERQVALLDAHPTAGLVAGRKQYWYSWSGVPEDATRDFIQPFEVPLDTLVQPPEFVLGFLKNEFTCLLDILIRRSAIDAVGGYEDAFRGLYEDQVFHSKLCLRFPVATVDGTWCRYRQHPKSSVSGASAAQFALEARRRFLNWLQAYIDAEHMTESRLRARVRTESFAVAHPRFTHLRRRFWRFRQQLIADVLGHARPAARH